MAGASVATSTYAGAPYSGAPNTSNQSTESTVENIINFLGGLFGGSTAPQTTAVINGYITTIVSDPALTTAAGQHAMLYLRCWAGDQTITAQYIAVSGDQSARTAGCGCEVAHGCRAMAVGALSQLATQLTTATVAGMQAAAGVAGAGGAIPANGVVTTVPGPGSTVTAPGQTTATNQMKTLVLVVVFVVIAALFFRSQK